MWTKSLGCTLLLGIGAWIARQRAQNEKRRLSLLDAWIELIGSMRWEIESRLTPIDRFFASADRQLLKTLGKTNAKSPSELLPLTAPFFSPEINGVLARFSESLGDCYREEQLRRCDECLTALRRIRERQAAELPARKRLGIALPLSAALGISILLW